MINFWKKSKEQDVIERNQKAAYHLVNSEYWGEIQKMFVDKMLDIQSVMNVDNSSPEKAVIDMKVRVNLARELKDILDSIVGAANAYQMNNQEVIIEETHIVVDK